MLRDYYGIYISSQYGILIKLFPFYINIVQIDTSIHIDFTLLLLTIGIKINVSDSTYI